VDRLESKGLVVRTRSTKDRRVVFLSLTQEAQTYLRGQPSILHREFIEKFNSLDSWEQHMLLGAVERIAEMIKPAGINRDSLRADDNASV
jgi:DNA-binding MarR family transcriptional regulator